MSNQSENNFTSPGSQALYRTLFDISIELTAIDNLDLLCRMIIKLGLERLEIDRLGLFLYDENEHLAIGTYGTGPTGEIQKEDHLRFVPRTDATLSRSLNDPDYFSHEERTTLYHNQIPIGIGSQVSVALHYRDRVLGWLTADNLITHQIFSPYRLEVITRYGMLIAATLARQLAEDAKRNSEQLLQNVLNTIPTRVFWKDRDAKLIGCNQKVVEDSGFTSAADLIGRSDADWLEETDKLPPWRDQAAKYLADDRQVIETGMPLLNYEEPQVRSDGKMYWVRTSKLPLKDTQGETIGLLGVYEDITERKQVEIALKQSEELFSKVFYFAPIGISISKLPEGHYVDVNPKWSTLFGYSRDEARGHSGKELGLWGEETLLAPILQEIMKKGGVEQIEIGVRHRDGTPLWVNYSAQIVDLNGEPHFFAMVSDSTDRKNAENARKISEERLRQAIRASSIGIFEHDHHTNELYFSPEYRAIYGWSLDEEITFDVMMRLDSTPAADRERIREAIEKAHDPSGNGLLMLERQVLDKHGGDHWIISRSRTFFEGEGAVRHKVRTIGAVVDITERKKTELTLEAKRRDEQEFRNYLQNLYEASLELTQIENLDEFYRRVVLIGLERFRFDRMGLWLFDPERNTAIGTYGTDSSGNLQPESHLQFVIAPCGGMWKALQTPDRYVFEESYDLQHNLQTVGKGWNVTIALRQGNRILGWLCVDNLIQHLPITQPQLDILSQYGLVVAATLGRKQVETTLKVSEERLRQAIHISKIGIFEVDEVTGASYFSPEHRAIFGWGVEEIVTPEMIYAQVRPEYRDQWTSNIARALDPDGNGMLFDSEIQVMDLQGVRHWITASSRTYFEGNDHGRHPVRTIGAITDITTYKEQEEALKRYNQRLTALQEIDRVIMSARSPLEVANAVLSRVGQLIPCEWMGIVLYDDKFCTEQIFACKQSFDLSVDVTNPQPVVHGKVFDMLQAGMSTVSGDLSVENDELSGLADELANNGFHSAMANPMFAEKKLIGVLALAAMSKDFFNREYVQIGETIAGQISIALYQADLNLKIAQQNADLERRVAERTYELERANEDIKNFAYIVSHDLRAPLVNLKGFAAELRSALRDIESAVGIASLGIDSAVRLKLENALHSDVPEALHFIEESVGQMDKFTRAILTLSRLGRAEFELVRTDARTVVDHLLAARAYQINSRQVEVTIGDLPVLVADGIALEQVFGNILTNALQYLRSDRPGKIAIRCLTRPEEYEFQVEDNGRGIAREDMPKVFAPFRRAGKQDVPGEGMGLAYVQAIVQRHGGRIWCESEIGIGTTFHFTFSRFLAP